MITGNCTHIGLYNTTMTIANIRFHGILMNGDIQLLEMHKCKLQDSHDVPFVLLVDPKTVLINDSIFSNNTGGTSVITVTTNSVLILINSSISDNSMTGITLIESHAILKGRNVIQNNRNTEGAGITMISKHSNIRLYGELFMVNNTADKQGGAIVEKKTRILPGPCSIVPMERYSLVIFSGNKAGKGGSDMYGSLLVDCYGENGHFTQHVGHSNETSWYFVTPLMKYFHFSNIDRLSSMSSDPIMVCFCNTTSNLPDCSDRTTHQIETYPGLEINTLIATVGYYGGTSTGDVLVSAQHATLVRNYVQNDNTNCFQLHILLQNTSSTTALVNISVDGGLQDWGVSIEVDVLECPIGFTEISGQCYCEQFLDNSNVKCNLSATPFRFLRSGNSWFAYINKTQCITGTTICPFDYCNQSNVSFDIMAPDRQCGNRVGIFCGQCQTHLSIMLGSNRCGTCSNWYLFLLPVFAFAGIVLVAVLMFLNLSVSVGTINGLLLYANVVKLNEAPQSSSTK